MPRPASADKRKSAWESLVRYAEVTRRECAEDNHSSSEAEHVLYESLGNGRNTVSRALLRKRELTEFLGKLGEFCDALSEFALAHTNNRLKGTH